MTAIQPNAVCLPTTQAPCLPSRRAARTGRVLSGLAAVFLGFDATVKLLQLPMALQATAELGYPTHLVFWLGVLQFVLLVLYLLPRTAGLGAALWTGYLGGAIATHLRIGNPWFSHVLFPIYIALLLWGGLWMRRPRLRRLLPLCLDD